MADKKNNSGMQRNVQSGLLMLAVAIALFFVARAVVQVRNLTERNAQLEERIARLEQWAAVEPDTLSARYVPFVPAREERPAAPAAEARAERRKESTSTPAQASTPQADYVPTTLNPKDDYPRQEKFKEPTRVELNAADTTLLKKIPGIGSATALNIIRYREELGGFYSPRQIGEKLRWERAQEMLPVWVSQWMAADTTLIRRLDVNSADFKTLLHHPYLSYAQVKALVNYRSKWGRLPSIDVLRQIEEFSEDDIRRLSYYLAF